jgi:hypothetical protein
MLSPSLFAGVATPDREITVFKTSVAPAIDGMEDDLWQDVVAYAVTQPDESTEYWELESGEDYAAWFKMTWDDENVYLFCWIMDDELFSDETADNDKIEFFFDADASGGITQEEYELDFAAEYGAAASWWFENYDGQTHVFDENCSQWVFEIDMPDNITGTQGPGLAWPGMAGSRFPTEGIVYQLIEANGGYTFEAAFPWQSLQASMPMTEGDRFGFNLQINDFDIAGERAFYNWIKDVPNANWCDPSVFGTVVLSDMSPTDGVSVMVGMAGTTPVIDGVMDEIWNYAMPRAVTIPNLTYGFSQLESQYDYVGTFRSLWDKNNIYFFFDVVDDLLYVEEEGDADDRIELFFDADASGGLTREEYEMDYAADYGAVESWWFSWRADQTQTYDENCSHWIFEIDEDDVIPGWQGPGLYWPGTDGSRLPTEGIQYEIVYYPDEHGYTMEITIPWESLNAASPMTAGDKIGFNIQMNDYDKAEERGFYFWRSIWDDSNWYDPSNFGLLELSAIQIGLPTSVAVKSDPRPSTFDLAQNYPNPFNPSTTIDFNLPTNDHVDLAIYDLLGRKVATLINDRLNAGTHSIIFNGSNLSSGVYFYRLKSSDQILTRKLTLVK